MQMTERTLTFCVSSAALLLTILRAGVEGDSSVQCWACSSGKDKWMEIIRRVDLDLIWRNRIRTSEFHA